MGWPLWRRKAVVGNEWFGLRAGRGVSGGVIGGHACFCGVPKMQEGMSWPASLEDDELADDSHTALAIAAAGSERRERTGVEWCGVGWGE